MRTTQVEVKTLYSIEITYEDFREIFLKASSDTGRLSSEFSNYDLKDNSEENVKKCWKSFCKFGWDSDGQKNRDTYYIIKCLGFDGIENYGLYIEKKNAYRMSVFNRGDCLGK